jgi:hypothetical protein
VRLYPTLATPGTPIDCHQPTLLYVELLLLIHHPLVVPMAAQGLAFMFFLEGAFLEGEDVGHAKSMGASTMARVWGLARWLAISVLPTYS